MEKMVEITSRFLWEYHLVAYPDESVCKKVMEIKRGLSETHNIESADMNKPHILVARFLAMESMEETMIRWIQRICSQLKGFPVTLNNYSGFPPHSIYLRVQDHEPFRQLASQLRVIDQYVTSNGCPPARLFFKPHIPIATTRDHTVYDNLMLDYSQKTFHETFHLSGLVLSKRKTPFDSCKEVNVFCFYPPDTNMYGEVA